MFNGFLVLKRESKKYFGIAALITLLTACSSDSSQQDPDPVVVDFAIAYIKRPLPVTQDDNEQVMLAGDDIREPHAFNPGAELYIRQRATADAQERLITDALFTDEETGETLAIDIKDLQVSYDGLKLLFALRAPEIEDADEDEQPTWNIWEYDSETDSMRRIIQSDIQAEAGQDIQPIYLVDGRIMFASTRNQQGKAILLDEGKPQYTGQDESRTTEGYNLHVMDADGANIRQVTYGPNHDLWPTLMSDGQIIFSRWEKAQRFNLFRMLPDGRNLHLLYGNHSHDTGTDGQTIQFTKPQELSDGSLLVTLRDFETERLSGLFTLIDYQNYIDNTQGTAANLSAAGPAQTDLFATEQRSDDDINRAGRYAAVTQLPDGTDRYLVSWSECRINQQEEDGSVRLLPCPDEELLENQSLADPQYSLWLYNAGDQTQLPIVLPQADLMVTEPVVMANRSLPDFIPDAVAGIDVDGSLSEQNLGLLHIRSVYDFDGEDNSGFGLDTIKNPSLVSAEQRPVRFMRLLKQVAIPDEDIIRSNGNNKRLMRDILGYTEVHPDGSVMVTVPANVPFTMQFLNADGENILANHENDTWLTVRPGETLTCNGCHQNNSTLPHGRPDAAMEPINTGTELDNSPHAGANPNYVAEFGETMAQTWARINGAPYPSVNLAFRDNWSPTPNEGLTFEHSYTDLETAIPTTLDCTTNWSGRCRVTIHYPDHIHPIWGISRQIIDEDTLEVLEDRTCNTCHAPQDADGLAQVPAAQLDLTDGQSNINNRFYNSYVELIANDNEQEVIDGVLIDRLVQAVDADGNPIFETDEDGNLILDDDGNPIPVMTTVNVSPSMAAGSAAASERFFSRFDAGSTHAGYLSAAELRLIREWLDTRARYYNNPFDVPQN